jgi:acetyltransferase-like isoleucine patch superfamily enzyme
VLLLAYSCSPYGGSELAVGWHRAIEAAKYNVGLIGRYDHDFKCLGKPIRLAPWVGDKGYSGLGKGLEVIIQDDVWIGFGAILISGVRIGRGAIVGVGSVVPKNVAPYSIVVGNPARCIGWRFATDEIAEHERRMMTI